jgi:hypothetical protein
MTVTVDDVVAAYIKLRLKKDAIKAEMETKLDDIKAKMQKMEAWIKERADEDGVTSYKTKHGTAFLTTTDYAQVADWDALLQHILENEAYDMFEKRVSKTAVRGYIQHNKQVPPGVNYGTKLEVNVRKPARKAEED